MIVDKLSPWQKKNRYGLQFESDPFWELRQKMIKIASKSITTISPSLLNINSNITNCPRSSLLKPAKEKFSRPWSNLWSRTCSQDTPVPFSAADRTVLASPTLSKEETLQAQKEWYQDSKNTYLWSCKQNKRVNSPSISSESAISKYVNSK